MAATPALYSLWLELEPRCNLNCRFCYNPWRPADAPSTPERLPSPVLLRALERLVSHFRFEYAALSGGEPLLYPNLQDIVRFLDGQGVVTILTTNGLLATRSRLTELARSGLRGVQVPLLSGTPSTHDYLAAAPSWHRAVTALALGVELGLTTSAVTVLSGPNAGQVLEIVLVCKLVGVDRLILNRVHTVGQGRLHASELDLDEATFTECVEQARAKSAGQFEVTVGTVRCASGAATEQARRLAVSPSGDLKLCNESSVGILRLVDASDGELEGLASQLQTAYDELLRASIDTCTCAGVGL